MKVPIRVLIAEDSEFDARILVNTLRQGGYEPKFWRVETAVDFRAALTDETWEVILSDYNMPEFTALDALKIAQESGLDLPFIIISGGIGEDIAVAAMKAGAHDYFMKGNLARLVPAVEREIREAIGRRAHRQAEAALRESELRYRLLWETATDAVVLIDSESRIHFANPAVRTVFGYEPGELVGQILEVLQPERLRELHRPVLQKFLAGGVSALKKQQFETFGRRKDGAEIEIEIGAGEMQLHGQRWFVGFIRDVTERKRNEQTLRENAEQFKLAREIQQRLFPKSSPRVPGFDIAGASYPADSTGGDYFDYLPMLNDHIGVMVGDVTGHGIGPALLMAETRAYLRIVARNREDVGEIFTRANLVLAEDVGNERFITGLLARLDHETRTLYYVNAGHPAGYLLDATGGVKLKLKRTGVPLGIRHNTVYKTAPSVQLAAGDVLLLLTDGIEEAASPEEDFFGSERILEIVRANQHRTAAEIVNELYEAARAFTQGQPLADDLTLIVVKVTA